MDNFDNRRRWFQEYFDLLEKDPIYAKRITCPCCGYPTLTGPRLYEICELCWWEDDGQDDPHANEV